MKKRSLVQRPDAFLLLEVVLGLVLFGLVLGLYWIPSVRSGYVPPLGIGLLLAALFFAILLLERWRRRRQNGLDMRTILDDVDPGRSRVDEPPPG